MLHDQALIWQSSNHFGANAPRCVWARRLHLQSMMTHALIDMGAPDGPLGAYLGRIEHYPLLTLEQERELALRWRNDRDPKAGRLLVTSNLRFVVKIALEYRCYGAPLLDLIQEGNLGLLVAVDRFEPERGVRLTTYAVWWIRAYVQEHIRRSWSLVRFGTTRAEQRCFYRLRRERQRLEHCGEADPCRLAEALGVDVNELALIEARITRRDMSLDDPLYGDAEETRCDRIADDRPSPESALAEQELSRHLETQIRQALAGLDVRERAIIQRRYLNRRTATLRELGQSFGISRERVRQLEARAKAKMKEHLAALWDAPPTG